MNHYHHHLNSPLLTTPSKHISTIEEEEESEDGRGNRYMNNKNSNGNNINTKTNNYDDNPITAESILSHHNRKLESEYFPSHSKPPYFYQHHNEYEISSAAGPIGKTRNTLDLTLPHFSSSSTAVKTAQTTEATATSTTSSASTIAASNVTPRKESLTSVLSSPFSLRRQSSTTSVATANSNSTLIKDEKHHPTKNATLDKTIHSSNVVMKSVHSMTSLVTSAARSSGKGSMTGTKSSSITTANALNNNTTISLPSNHVPSNSSSSMKQTQNLSGSLHDNGTVTLTAQTSNHLQSVLYHRPNTTFINCPSRIHSSLEFILRNEYGGSNHNNPIVIENSAAAIRTTTATNLVSQSVLVPSNSTTIGTATTSLGGTNNSYGSMKQKLATTPILPSKTNAEIGYSTSTNVPLKTSTSTNSILNSLSRSASTKMMTDDSGHNNATTTNSNIGGINSYNNNNNSIKNATLPFSNNYYNMTNIENNEIPNISPTWRLKERMKTVGVALILALNIGTDPPDVHKPNPCSKLICWMDPTSTSRSKARDIIAENLVNQYAQWQGQQRAKLKYKKAPDPTVEDVRNVCVSMRRAARNERLLLHYNGYGVPRPTTNGEIWVFDRHHRQYIPLAISDVKKWIGKPSLIVLDCSGAGALLPYLTQSSNYDHIVGNSGVDGLDPYDLGSSIYSTGSANSSNYGLNFESSHGASSSTFNVREEEAQDDEDDVDGTKLAETVRDFIVLCPTSASETLPMNPELPADLFTSCLTTPIPMALRWFIYQNPMSCSTINPDDVDLIPGKLTDRKSPLGELNWIFTAITDNIAWNILPSALFQRLFRQDLLVASMFRNFLLADRILRELNCTPMSHPPLPSTCDHPLWQAWDLAVETCLSQLVREGILGPSSHLDREPIGSESADDALENTSKNGDDYFRGNGVIRAQSDSVLTNRSNHSSDVSEFNMAPLRSLSQSLSPSSNLSYNITAPFFAEQLTAFEIWLDFAATRIKEGGKILDPPKKQKKAGSCQFDINSPDQLPVVLQVLLSPAHRVRALVLLRQFLNLGPSATNLSLSVGVFPYVLRLLNSQIDEYKHILIGIWNKILEFDPTCQVDLVKDGALPHFITHLNWGIKQTQKDMKSGSVNNMSNNYTEEDILSKVGICHQRTMAAVILSAICYGYPNGQSSCMENNLHGTCCKILQSIEESDSNQMTTKFRMWLCICLGVLFNDLPAGREEAFRSDVHLRLFSRTNDDSADVRAAACYALGSLVGPSDRRIIKKEETRIDQQETNDSSQTTSHMLSPSPLTYKASSPQQNMSPLGNLQLQHLQPMQQYNNMTYNFSDSVSVGLLSSRQPDSPFFRSFSPQPSSVFDDKISFERDLLIVENMLPLCNDASPTVRFEATIVLGKVVDRYVMAFVSIANNVAKDTEELNDSGIAIPSGIGYETESLFTKTWEKMRYLHQTDPHPVVSAAATSILRFVNEHMLVLKSNFNRIKKPQRTNSARRLDIAGKTIEDNDRTSKRYLRTHSAVNLGEHKKMFSMSMQMRLSSLHEVSESDSDRSASPNTPNIVVDDYTEGERNHLDCHIEIDLMNILPTSKFYEWKKELFAQDNPISSSKPVDPLSSDGAIQLYRKQRNLKIDTRCADMSARLSILNPKRHVRRRSILEDLRQFSSHGDFIDLENDSNDEAEFDAEVSSKKKALHLDEKSLLSDDKKNGTYMLCFHPYEPVLASSDGHNCVTLWDTERSVKLDRICTCDTSTHRMTSMCWINERNNSLLLTGCDDGSVRIFDHTIKHRSQMNEVTQLTTAFLAMPDLEPTQRGSGLITEWQQYTGRLITGGNASFIRCWDLESQKCISKIDTNNIRSCLTTLETAWDYVQCGGSGGGYSGIGTDVVLGGYSDGMIKVFDLRVQGRKKIQEIREHEHWIVNVCFSHCGSRNEVVSGSIYGDVKFWDMRNLRSSINTQEIQRSLTAFACHPRIPLLASGSHANFIKLFTPDGDVLQVVRHHKNRSTRKIGPVSCLSFHPNKPMLAAGTTDEIISVYESSFLKR